MRSTFLGFEIARTGLQVSQKGLDVTGHNISNVDTPGFTRQRTVNTSREPFNSVPVWRPMDTANVGFGTRVVILDQMRSAFLDRQFRTEQSLYSNWATRTQGLTYVESLYESEDGSTVEDNINNLFSAFLTLSTDPDTMATRVNVFNAASSLTDNITTMFSRLKDMQQDQNLAIDTLMLEVNTIAQNIGELNKAIYAYELGTQPANDLRDKRNLLMDELAALVDIKYTGDAIGEHFRVWIADQELINHTAVSTLERTYSSIDDITGLEIYNYQMVSANGDIADFDTDKVKGGELRGHLDLRDSTDEKLPGIPFFVNKLNILARAIVHAFNSVQVQGYTHPLSPYNQSTLAGDPNNILVPDDPNTPDDDTVKGQILFFEDYGNLAKVTAGNLSVSAAIKESVYNIAASDRQIFLAFDESGNVPLLDENGNQLYVSADGNPYLMAGGQQTNARAFYDLINQGIQFSIDGVPTSIGTFTSYFQGIVLDVALTLNQSKEKTDNYSIQLLSSDTQRTSVSGVSLDEEMTSLIKYQHAYQGASRVITVMDDILDMIINRMGRVGL